MDPTTHTPTDDRRLLTPRGRRWLRIALWTVAVLVAVWVALALVMVLGSEVTTSGGAAR
jgi:hypothetical protein